MNKIKKRTILLLSIVAGLLLACNSDDGINIPPESQSCETTNLQLTQSNANPFPNNPDDMYMFTDWTWTMNEVEQVLILMYEQHNTFEFERNFEKHYFYFSTDNDCVDYIKRGSAVFQGITQIDDNGNEVFMQSDLYSVADDWTLQEFEANLQLVGQVPLTESKTIGFWVELTQANHIDLLPIEINSGF